jgi:hypothetical protein
MRSRMSLSARLFPSSVSALAVLFTPLKVPAEAPCGATMIGPVNARAAVGAVGVEFHHVYRNQIDEQSFAHAVEQRPSRSSEASPSAEGGLRHLSNFRSRTASATIRT